MFTHEFTEWLIDFNKLYLEVYGEERSKNSGITTNMLVHAYKSGSTPESLIEKVLKS